MNERAEGIARDLFNVLGASDESAHNALSEAALKAIVEGSGYSNPRDAADGYRSDASEFKGPIALYVKDAYWDMFDFDNDDSLMATVLKEVVSYGDSELWWEFADYFMPDADDVDEYVGEDEDDESDSETGTLGSCGCVDYHAADCPTRTAAHDELSAADWDPYGDER